MSRSNYLRGNAYHMTHLMNLRSILQNKALFSRSKIEESGTDITSIADNHIQKLRDRILVHSDVPKQDSYLSLHDYVPFYFATRTAMLRRQNELGIQNEIIYFAVSWTILEEQGVLFTDGNATNQQLSQTKGECVLIKPAVLLSDKCGRIYLPDGPHGKNENCSDFYAGNSFYDRLYQNCLNLQVIIDKRSGIGDKKRQKQAEVLVPNIVSLDRIQGIYARTPEMVRAINTIIDEHGLIEHIPSAIARPDLHFS